MRVIFAALVAALFVTPAFASHNPLGQPMLIDAASVAPYPIEMKIVAHARRHHIVKQERSVRHDRSDRRSPKAEIVAKAKPTAKDQSRLPDQAEEYEDGIATAHPIIVTDDRPKRIDGVLKIADAVFHFASGGYGWSIPYGDYEISSNSEGDWGARHGALDLTGVDRGDIWDPLLGRHRGGIELHGGGSVTMGCVSIDQWSLAKRKILSMIDKFGTAFLHVWPHKVTVTPEKSSGNVIVTLHRSMRTIREAHDDERRSRHISSRRIVDRHRHYRHYAKG